MEFPFRQPRCKISKIHMTAGLPSRLSGFRSGALLRDGLIRRDCERSEVLGKRMI
jgi:hypothetical protein